VERIEFSAGPDAIKAAQKERALLEKTAEELGVPVDQAPSAAQKFVKEWKELRTRVSSLEKELASFKSSNYKGVSKGSITYYSQEFVDDTNLAEVQKIVRELTSEEASFVAMSFPSGDKCMVILAKSDFVNVHCGKVLKDILASLGGSGGGKESYAQGSFPKEKWNDLRIMLNALSNRVAEASG
jgi:alanyl-tRNA synthetase